MTEHEQWVNKLKCGDRVAVKNRSIVGLMGSDMGWRLYSITRITPKRTRFELTPRTTKLPTISLTSNAIQPITSEILDSIAGDTNRIRARNKATEVLYGLTEIFRSSSTFDWTRAETQLDALRAFLDSHKKE